MGRNAPQHLPAVKSTIWRAKGERTNTLSHRRVTYRFVKNWTCHSKQVIVKQMYSEVLFLRKFLIKEPRWSNKMCSLYIRFVITNCYKYKLHVNEWHLENLFVVASPKFVSVRVFYNRVYLYDRVLTESCIPESSITEYCIWQSIYYNVYNTVLYNRV